MDIHRFLYKSIISIWSQLPDARRVAAASVIQAASEGMQPILAGFHEAHNSNQQVNPMNLPHIWVSVADQFDETDISCLPVMEEC